MPRPLRIEFPGAWYHVMNRGINYQNIYNSNKQRITFLELLAETSEQFKLEVHGYCLMDNHYHLLVHTPDGNLSKAMRHINGVYTQRYNRMTKSDGPLFRGRYKAILIEGDSYLLQVSRYIHLNPIKANIVNRLETYPWSSYRSYILLGNFPNWLKTNKILSIIGTQNPVEKYKNFVLDGIDEATNAFYNKKNVSVYLGNIDNKRKRISNFTVKKIEASVTDYRRLEAKLNLEDIIAICSEYFGCTRADFQKIKRGKNNVSRSLTIYACRKWSYATLEEIAKMFGAISSYGISNAIIRVKDKINSDKIIKDLYDKLNRKIREKMS